MVSIHCARGSQNSTMACDIRESIKWVRFAFLFADISFASSLPLIVFQSNASKPDSNSQFVFLLHRNNHMNNPHTRSPPIDSEVSNVDLKFHCFLHVAYIPLWHTSTPLCDTSAPADFYAIPQFVSFSASCLPTSQMIGVICDLRDAMHGKSFWRGQA